MKINSILYPFLISFLAGISTLIGYIFIFIKVKNTNKFISISLSFSSCIMLLISIFDLIPNSFMNVIKNHKYIGIIFTILSFTLGVLLISFFNRFIMYLEKKQSSLYKLGIISAIVLMLHNIPEGIITFITSGNNIKLGIKIATAIALHNIPEGICIAVPIFYSTRSYFKAFLYTFISGISELIGAVISYLFLYKYVNITILNLIFIFVAGIMINLSINEILKESIKYSNKNNKYIYTGFLIAIVLFIFSLLFT